MKTREIFSPEATAADLLKQDKLSLRALQKRTGISKSRLGRMRNGSGEVTIKEAIALSSVFGIPTAAFFPEEQSLTLTDQQNNAASTLGAAMSSAINQRIEALGPELSTDAVESWYFNTQGKLVDMPDIAKYLTLFRAPKTSGDAPEVVKVGGLSLAAEKVGSETHKVANYLGYLKEVKSEALAGYHIVAEQNTMQSFYRQVVFPDQDNPILMLYKTLLMPVVEHGEMLIWNFSKKVSVRLIEKSELEGLSIPLGD